MIPVFLLVLLTPANAEPYIFGLAILGGSSGHDIGTSSRRGHLSHSLNSLKRGYRGLYIGDYCRGSYGGYKEFRL